MSDLKDILNKCLFFTGAGFSQPAGCKMSKEMLEDLENKVKNNELFTKAEGETIKFILSCLDYHARWRTLEDNSKYKFKPNIEEFALLLRRIKNRENLLPYPVTGNWSDKITKLERDFEIENKNSELDLYDSIEQKIITKCYNEWLSITLTNFLFPLKNFLKEIPQIDTKLNWFTLNNDTLLETFFNEEKSVYTGFVNKKWVGFEKENIDDDTYNDGRINYYKLHGSINWARMNDGTVKIKSDDIDEENIEIDPFLIFGYGTKLFTVEPFFSLLKAFHNKLNRKKYFFIIGYSFFDPHINNLFAEALINNEEGKKMIIVDPNLTALNDSYFENKYGFKNVLKQEYHTQLIQFFFDIQKNPFYSDTPKFNISKLSVDNFIYIKTNTQDFLSNIFGKQGGRYNLVNIINLLSKEEKQKAQIF